MRQVFSAACFVGLLLLAGCAGKAPKPPPEPPPWKATTPCVSALAELPRIPLLPNKQTLWHGDFRTIAACLERSNANHPVILLALDAESAQQELDLLLHIGKDYLLGAAISVLDEAHQPLRNHAFDDFTRRGSHFSLRLFPQPGRFAAYVLIEVDDEAHGSDIDRISGRRIQSMWMAGGYMGSIADGTESRQRIAIRDTGHLSLLRVIEASDETTDGRRRR